MDRPQSVSALMHRWTFGSLPVLDYTHPPTAPLSEALLSAVSVIRGKLQSKNITWKIPEINNS